MHKLDMVLEKANVYGDVHVKRYTITADSMIFHYDRAFNGKAAPYETSILRTVFDTLSLEDITEYLVDLIRRANHLYKKAENASKPYYICENNGIVKIIKRSDGRIIFEEKHCLFEKAETILKELNDVHNCS